MAATLAREWVDLKIALKKLEEAESGAADDKKPTAVTLQHCMKSIEFCVWLLSAMPDGQTRFGVKKANLLDEKLDAMDSRDTFPYLVRPPVLPPKGATWAFPGGARFLLSIDLKDKSANVVQSKANSTPVADFKTLWRPAPKHSSDSYASSQSSFNWDTGLVSFKEKQDESEDPAISGEYHLLSAAQALYRTRCLFPTVEVQSGDGYKCVWGLELEHIPSGGRVSISEHSATFSFYACAHKDNRSWDDAFLSDAAALLALLLSTECRHPCGVPAGTVDPDLLGYWPALQGAPYLVDPVYAGTGSVEDEEERAAGSKYVSLWAASETKDCGVIPGSKALRITFNKTTGKISLDAPVGDKASKKAKIGEPACETEEGDAKGSNGSADEVPLCAAISSAMLLYRLRARFHLGQIVLLLGPESLLGKTGRIHTPMAGDAVSSESVWHMELVHKATRLEVRFGDWRGAAAVWLKDPENGGWANGEAKQDLAKLLEFLCSNKCADPYDGVVAGCCA